MVEHIHAAGGLAQLDHPGGGPGLGSYLVDTQAMGCDLVEIGRNPLEGYICGFEVAARNAVFFTATGVNDAHSDYWPRSWPWATSSWSKSTEMADLVVAMRAGRAWMTNPDHWSGQLDFEIHGRPAMGAVVVDTPPNVNIRIVATDLPEGGVLEIIKGAIDFPGGDPPRDKSQTDTIPAASVRDGQLHVRVQPGHYVRTAVRDGDGQIVGLSNPVWLLRHGTDVVVPPAREMRLR